MRNARITGVLVVGACGLLAIAGCNKETKKEAPPPPAVTVSLPVVREVLDYDEYTGKLMAVEEVEVRARVKGYLDSIGFKDGDEVKKGQLLFQIDPKPFDAQVKIAQGQVDQLKARRARGWLRKRPMTVPKPAQTATEPRHAAASTPAITDVCHTTSPPTLVWPSRTSWRTRPTR